MIDYEKNTGKRLADFSSRIYSSANGIVGQCVWYVRCRALEKCRSESGIYGNANTWYKTAQSKGLKLSARPVSNSIACFNSGRYGHVIFIECADGETVYYTEANSNGDNRLSPDDGILRKQNIKSFTARKGYQGCIIVGDSSEKPASHEPTFKIGRNYTLTVNLKVRVAAGTDSCQKKRCELTADGKKHSLNQTFACLKRGTVVTLLQAKEINGNIWGRIPSGWIALYYNKELFAE